jgi:hypothetical protein
MYFTTARSERHVGLVFGVPQRLDAALVSRVERISSVGRQIQSRERSDRVALIEGVVVGRQIQSRERSDRVALRRRLC